MKMISTIPGETFSIIKLRKLIKQTLYDTDIRAVKMILMVEPEESFGKGANDQNLFRNKRK